MVRDVKNFWSKTERDDLNSSGLGYDVPPEPPLAGPADGTNAWLFNLTIALNKTGFIFY